MRSLLTLAPLTLLPLRAFATHYVITDLGTLGGSTSQPRGINNLGQVVGDSYLSDNTTDHPFLYSNGVMTDLGTLGGTSGVAWAINDSGQITGDADLPGDHVFHAFLYNNAQIIDVTPGASISYGYGIDASGRVVGNVYSTSGPFLSHAFAYSAGTYFMLDTLPGQPENGADSISSNGQYITGWSDNQWSNSRAVTYLDQTLSLESGPISGKWSTGREINNSGQIVGDYFSSGTTNRGFLYSNGAVTDLGTLGGTLSHAESINNLGQIVGSSTLSGDTISHATIYQNNSLTDLNTLINPAAQWSLSIAYAINDHGQIAGQGINPNGQIHAFLLTPAALGDANLDGSVDLTDLSTILNNFASTTPNWTSGNFDNAPTIDLTDLSDVLNNFGAVNTSPNATTSLSNSQSPPLSPAPEPASLYITATALALLVRRRKN